MKVVGCPMATGGFHLTALLQVVAAVDNDATSTLTNIPINNQQSIHFEINNATFTLIPVYTFCLLEPY